MKILRRPRQSSSLLPDRGFVRTLQAPDHVVFDKAEGRYRLSSKAFGPSTADRNLSGDLEELIVQDGLQVSAFYPAVPRAIGAVELKIGAVRTLGLEVHHHPVEANWYHGSISGIKSSHKDKLKRIAISLIDIDQLEAARFEREKNAALNDNASQ